MSDSSKPTRVGSHDGLGPCAQVPVHPRHGRLWANVRPTGADTPVPGYPMDDLYDQAALDAAVAAERERICAAIKAEDDHCAGGDYMLDSDDCIKVARGQWQRPDWGCGPNVAI